MTLFGSHGRYRIEQLQKGDVGYIPQGYGHSLENTGSRPARVLIGFNAGIYETIELSQWIAANSKGVLATNFGQPPSYSESSPTGMPSSRQRMERVFDEPGTSQGGPSETGRRQTRGQGKRQR